MPSPHSHVNGEHVVFVLRVVLEYELRHDGSVNHRLVTQTEQRYKDFCDRLRVVHELSLPIFWVLFKVIISFITQHAIPVASNSTVTPTRDVSFPGSPVDRAALTQLPKPRSNFNMPQSYNGASHITKSSVSNAEQSTSVGSLKRIRSDDVQKGSSTDAVQPGSKRPRSNSPDNEKVKRPRKKEPERWCPGHPGSKATEKCPKRKDKPLCRDGPWIEHFEKDHLSYYQIDQTKNSKYRCIDGCAEEFDSKENLMGHLWGKHMLASDTSTPLGGKDAGQPADNSSSASPASSVYDAAPVDIQNVPLASNNDPAPPFEDQAAFPIDTSLLQLAGTAYEFDLDSDTTDFDWFVLEE